MYAELGLLFRLDPMHCEAIAPHAGVRATEARRGGTNLAVLRLRARRKGSAVTHFWSLSAAGFAATAIGFGPARMGFGLFVPEFRVAFSMSSSAVGLVSSLGFLGFLIGLLLAQALLNRRGPGGPVLSGLAAAAIGMALVAVASNLPVLAIGVFSAASSAGLAWTPFNNAIHRYVSEENRTTALSVVSTGTGIGIALAGFAALVMVLTGISWRLCWGFFAAASAAALLGNWAVFRRIDKNAGGAPRDGWKDMLHAPVMPLFVIGFAYGPCTHEGGQKRPHFRVVRFELT